MAKVSPYQNKTIILLVWLKKSTENCCNCCEEYLLTHLFFIVITFYHDFVKVKRVEVKDKEENNNTLI